jgi:hypothetical protein
VISALVGLDALIAAVGRRRGWTKPVAWLAPTLTIAGAFLFAVVLFPSFGANSRGIADRYQALSAQMAASGMPLDASGPVITDFPIWLSAATGAEALALPAETPADVIDLARYFGSRTLIVSGEDHGGWPGILGTGAPRSECFQPVDIGIPADPGLAQALASTHVYRLVCP